MSKQIFARFRNVATSTLNRRLTAVRRRSLFLESLEERRVLTAYTVTNTNDSGTGSLRWAIDQANNHSGADSVNFSSAFTGNVNYIYLTSGPLLVNDDSGTTTVNGPGAGYLGIIESNSDVYANNRAIMLNDASLVLNDISILNSGGGYQQSGTVLSTDSQLTLNNVWMSGNSASNFGSGGAIRAQGTGSLSINDSLLLDNDAYFNGGAIVVGDSVVLSVSRSAFYDNDAFGYGGGAISLFSSSNSTITNSTFSGNIGAGGGGAISKSGTGTLTIRNSTIANNRATGGAINYPYGGGIAASLGTVNLLNTLFADNTTTGAGPDVYGTIVSLGNNLVESTSGSSGFTSADLRNLSAEIDPLVVVIENGAYQAYHPLQSDSPALNSGATYGSQDQRGFSRQSGSAQDIGAIEAQYPTANANGPYSVPEGGSIGLSSAGSGDADGSLNLYQWDFNYTGTFTVDSTTANPTFSAAALDGDASRTVALRVRDNNGLYSAIDTAVVTIINVNPTILSVSNDGPVDEGSSVTVSVSATDPIDSLLYEFDFDNNGSYEVGPQSSSSADHVFEDNGSYVVNVRVTDGDGGAASSSTTIDVDNVDPVADAGADQTVDEGLVTLNGTFTDAGTNDGHLQAWSVVANNGDVVLGQTTNNLAGDDDGAGGSTFSFTAGDNGIYTVTYTVTDDDGGSHFDEAIITVNNAAPAIESVAATSVDENGTVTLTGTYSDAGALDTHSIDIDWGPGETATLNVLVSGGTFSVTHQYLDDNPTLTSSNLYTIGVTITDDDLATDFDSTDTLITNVIPVVETLVSSAPDALSSSVDGHVSISGSYSDIGTLDTHTVLVDWGDGSPVESISVDQGADTFSGEHDYANGGIYPVTVTAVDDDSGESLAAETTAAVQGVGLVDGTLFVVGRATSDSIVVRPTWDGSQIEAFLLPSYDLGTFPAGAVESIEVFGLAGNDSISIDYRLTIPARIEGNAGYDSIVGGSGDDYIDGGADADTISGGAGHDIVLGGSGDDWISGDAGLDILIGGSGRDVIVGGLDDDIVLGGNTTLGEVDLRAALAIWINGNPFSTRIGELGGHFNSTTVIDDEIADYIYGSTGRDWLLDYALRDYFWDYSADPISGDRKN